MNKRILILSPIDQTQTWIWTFDLHLNVKFILLKFQAIFHFSFHLILLSMILKENYFLILFEFGINQKCAHLQTTMNFMYSSEVKIKMRNWGRGT